MASYVVGFVSWETASLGRDPQELVESLRARAGNADVRKYLEDKIARMEAIGDDAFELGLNAMLNGLEELLRSSHERD
jgi:hypothetical protein